MNTTLFTKPKNLKVAHAQISLLTFSRTMFRYATISPFVLLVAGLVAFAGLASAQVSGKY